MGDREDPSGTGGTGATGSNFGEVDPGIGGELSGGLGLEGNDAGGDDPTGADLSGGVGGGGSGGSTGGMGNVDVGSQAEEG